MELRHSPSGRWKVSYKHPVVGSIPTCRTNFRRTTNLNYRGFSIEQHSPSKFFVQFGDNGQMFFSNLEDAKSFVDYYIKKKCYT